MKLRWFFRRSAANSRLKDRLPRLAIQQAPGCLASIVWWGGWPNRDQLGVSSERWIICVWGDARNAPNGVRFKHWIDWIRYIVHLPQASHRHPYFGGQNKSPILGPEYQAALCLSGITSFVALQWTTGGKQDPFGMELGWNPTMTLETLYISPYTKRVHGHPPVMEPFFNLFDRGSSIPCWRVTIGYHPPRVTILNHCWWSFSEVLNIITISHCWYHHHYNVGPPSYN